MFLYIIGKPPEIKINSYIYVIFIIVFPEIAITKFKYLFIIGKFNGFNNNDEKIAVFTDKSPINPVIFYLSNNVIIIIQKIFRKFSVIII